MPLTDTQRSALVALRAMLSGFQFPVGTAESVEQRARHPAPDTLPPDVTVRIEIAPPSANPDPTLTSTGVLKTPERVPIYFYTLHDDSDATTNPEEIANTRVVFFIHGGGNVTGHPTDNTFLPYYIQLLHALASHSRGVKKSVLIAPSYRLATVPENSFPAGLQDLVSAYDYVLSKGYKACNIFVAGDSAGGNNAIVLTHLVLQSGKPSPHGVMTIAPGSIMDQDRLSEHAKSLAERDLLDPSVTEKMISAYIGNSGIDRSNALVSAAFLNFTTSWPKTLILVGDADMGIDASRELKKRIAAAGRPVELVEYDERPHAWWVLEQLFSEDIQDSAERIARFVLD